MVVQYPCKICCKPVASNHKSVQCDHCNIWVHIKCNKINKQTYELLKKDKTTWYCIDCTKNILPFSNVDNKELLYITKGKIIKFTGVSEKRIPDRENFIKRMNLTTEDIDLTTYYKPEELSHNLAKNKKNINFLHLNISSLPYHHSELHNLLGNCNIDFQIIGITESRLKANKASGHVHK